MKTVLAVLLTLACLIGVFFLGRCSSANRYKLVSGLGQSIYFKINAHTGKVWRYSAGKFYEVEIAQTNYADQIKHIKFEFEAAKAKAAKAKPATIENIYKQYKKPPTLKKLPTLYEMYVKQVEETKIPISKDDFYNQIHENHKNNNPLMFDDLYEQLREKEEKRPTVHEIYEKFLERQKLKKEKVSK